MIVRVTTTTEILSEATGQLEFSVTKVSEERGANPGFFTRMAFRRNEENGDVTRLALGKAYGEVESAWRDS